jgi:competence protein ComEA
MENTAAPWRVLDDADGGSEGGDVSEAVPGRWLTPRLIAGLAAAAALAIAAFLVAATGPSGSVEVDGGSAFPEIGSSASSGTGATEAIVVDIQGAVMRPGIQRLPAGSRVGDAIAAAGGYGPRVDAARAADELNLAAVVSDGDRIVVPARGDPPAVVAGGSGGGDAVGGLVNVNTASASELDGLPGVGPVTAQKIIDARTEKPFATVDELKERKVLGAAAFEKLRNLVTVR